MGLHQSSLLLAALTDHRNQLCRLGKMPSDEQASSASTAIFLRQVCRKLSADSRNRVVELVASALAGYRPPSKTATSASELPLRSMPRSCCLPLNADLTIFTVPSSTIRSSRHTSPSPKIRVPSSKYRRLTPSAIWASSASDRSVKSGSRRSVLM
jgi:hypothetical protein